jgi:hypothetical protein
MPATHMKLLRPWVKYSAVSFAMLSVTYSLRALIPRNVHIPIIKAKPYEVEFDLKELHRSQNIK